MQILSHFPNPLSSHTFWILPILPNSLFPSNYISFVTTKIFFPHLSLSQFHLQIQSNTITIPRFLSSVFFHSIPERPIVHSPCPKSPLLRCSQITLPSFPLNPLFHRFFFPSPPPPPPPSIITYRELFSTLFFHPFVQSLLRLLCLSYLSCSTLTHPVRADQKPNGN